MKRLLVLTTFAISTVVAHGGYELHDEIVAKIEAAKAACPNCYRVIATNGVWQGFTREGYAAYVASERQKAVKSKRLSAEARQKLLKDRKARVGDRIRGTDAEKAMLKRRARMRKVTKPHKSQVK